MAGGSDYRLPADALVVRGGLMLLADLKNAALLGAEGLGQPCLSVYAGEMASAEQLLATVPALARYGSFRKTTAGTLRAAGFDLAKTGGPWHFTIWLDSIDYMGDIERLIDLFEPPEPNPLKPA